MSKLIKEVITIDFSKMDGKSVKLVSKTGKLVTKYEYENGVVTDRVRCYQGEFLIASGDLAGLEVSVKFSNDYSHLLEPLAEVEIEYDKEKCILWSPKNSTRIDLSLWGKSLKLAGAPRTGNTGV